MMTINEPNIALQGRYSIGDAAHLLGIHRNTLRKYTEQGLVKCRFRRDSGRKFYIGHELIKLWRGGV